MYLGESPGGVTRGKPVSLSDLEPLSKLTHLEELDLSHNSMISDLAPITGLRALVELNLRGTDWPSPQLEKLQATLPQLKILRAKL